MKNTQQQTKQTRTNEAKIPVVLIRHAQSQWNKENRFTGWADPPLTVAGIDEARQATALLRQQGYQFDVAYSSRLQRAIQTLDILLEGLDQADIPRYADWHLNERHYGALQGVDKAEAATQVGDQQVWRWRRGYHDKAEPLSRRDTSHPIHDQRYADVHPLMLPDVENLAETRDRVRDFWMQQMQSRIRKGERVLISAHGNTLRALLMELAGMSIAEVESFEIPTATPIVYRFDKKANPLDWLYLEGSIQSKLSA